MSDREVALIAKYFEGKLEKCQMRENLTYAAYVSNLSQNGFYIVSVNTMKTPSKQKLGSKSM